MHLLAAGSNAQGQLANGTDEDAHTFRPCHFDPPLQPEDDIVHVACGANHTVALISSRVEEGKNQRPRLIGCGDGRAGQLGPDMKSSTTMFRPMDASIVYQFPEHAPKLVAAGWQTTYVVLFRLTPQEYQDGDIVLSMGADDFGDLGIGGLQKGTNGKNPFHCVSFDHLGIAASSFTVSFISARQHHVVAQLTIRQTGEHILVGWGAARHGQLGGDATNPAKPSPPVQSLPVLIPLPRPYLSAPSLSITQAAVSSQHTALLTSSGRVLCFGSNRKGQYSGTNSLSGVQAVGCTWNGTYTLVTGEPWGRNKIIAAGSNAKGQRGTAKLASELEVASAVEFCFPSADCSVRTIACGSEHVLCLVCTSAEAGGTSEVWAWGWNEHGNLGLGTTEDVRLPARIWPPPSPPFPPSPYSGHSDGSISPERNRQTLRPVRTWAGSGTSWILLGDDS